MRLSIVVCAAIVLFSSAISVFCQCAQAEDVGYISDSLMINLKDQINPPYSVVSIVKSGDPVTIVDNKGNYLKIVTADNKTGWIGKQYVKHETPKPVIIKQLQHEIETLRRQLAIFQSEDSPPTNQATDDCLATLGNLEQKLRDAEATIVQLEKNQEPIGSGPDGQVADNEAMVKLQNDHNNLNKDLAKTREEYVQLVAEFDKRGKLIAELQNNLAKQDNKTKFLWFGVGALVFFFGLLAGKAGSRKKSKFY